MKEEWKVIKEAINAPKYEISNMGRVRSVETGRILKISYQHKTPVVNVPTTQSNHPVVYRLVAKYFLEAKGSFRVSFKDGDNTNLRADNLQVNNLGNYKRGVYYRCCDTRTGEVRAFNAQGDIKQAYGVHTNPFNRLKSTLASKGIIVSEISDYEYYQINRDKLRERKEKTRQEIREFLEYAIDKYGRDWHLGTEIDKDPVAKAHWKKMRTVQ